MNQTSALVTKKHGWLRAMLAQRTFIVHTRNDRAKITRLQICKSLCCKSLLNSQARQWASTNNNNKEVFYECFCKLVMLLPPKPWRKSLRPTAIVRQSRRRNPRQPNSQKNPTAGSHQKPRHPWRPVALTKSFDFRGVEGPRPATMAAPLSLLPPSGARSHSPVPSLLFTRGRLQLPNICFQPLCARN